MSEDNATQAPPEATHEGNGQTVKRYSLRLKTIDVTLEDNNGLDREWQLREMDGDLRDQFLSKSNDRLKIGKVNSVKDFKGVYAELISFCLYDGRTDKAGRVPMKQIQRFPSSTQIAMFRDCQEMNGLNKEAEADAKND